MAIANFTSADVRRLRQGRKTSHRVLVRFEERERASRMMPCPFHVGSEYSVLLKGQSTGLSLWIGAVCSEKLEAITHEGACREGYRSVIDFRDAWVAQHDRKWLYLWHERDGTWMEIAERFSVCWGRKVVWVVEYEVFSAPRLLHTDSSRGYTADSRRALKGEGEAVDSDYLEKFEGVAEKGRIDRALSLKLWCESRCVSDRIAWLKQEFQYNAIVMKDIRMIEFLIRKVRSDTLSVAPAMSAQIGLAAGDERYSDATLGRITRALDKAEKRALRLS